MVPLFIQAKLLEEHIEMLMACDVIVKYPEFRVFFGLQPITKDKKVEEEEKEEAADGVTKICALSCAHPALPMAAQTVDRSYQANKIANTLKSINQPKSFKEFAFLIGCYYWDLCDRKRQNKIKLLSLQAFEQLMCFAVAHNMQYI